MSRRVRVAAYLVGLLAMAAIAAYLLNRRELVDALFSVSPLAMATIVLVSFVVTVLNGAQFNEAARTYGLQLSRIEWYGLSITNTMLNYALPARGGTLARAAYMKSRYGLSLTRFASLTASSQLLMLATACLLGLALSLWVTSEGSAVPIGVYATLLGLLGGVVVIYALVTRVRPSTMDKSRWRGRLGTFADGFRDWSRSPASAFRYIALGVVWAMLQGIRLWLAFAAIGVEVSVGHILLIQSLVVVSGTLSVIPGNLGLKEGVTALGAALLGLDPSLALVASLLDRAAALVVTVVLGLLFSHILLKGFSGGAVDNGAETKFPSG